MSPLRRFAPALPEGEPRAWWVSVDGRRGKDAVGVDGRRESDWLLQLRISLHEDRKLSLRQSLTAFGGAPFAQGSLSRYHAFGLIDNPKFFPPSIDTHRTLASSSIYRHPPSPWLSLRESWREAPERAHCTDSTHKLPTDTPHRSPIRNCIPARTVCTSLSPSLREVPLRSGEARAGWKLQAAA